jgi:curved DNA-binding protein
MNTSHSEYKKVVADVYAACLAASDDPDTTLVDEAVSSISSDERLQDKSATLRMLFAAVEDLMVERKRSAMLHRLKVSAIVAAAAELDSISRSGLCNGVEAIRRTAERVGCPATVSFADLVLPHLQQTTVLATIEATKPDVEDVFVASHPSPEPAYITAQLRTSVEMSLVEYIRMCGITNTTSDKIHFAPAIPARKLQGAGESLGGRASSQDIVVLVDDTVFGGAKEGVFITNSSLFVKEKFVPLAQFSLDAIDQIQADGNKLYINGHRVVGLTMPEALQLRHLFHEVSTWLQSNAKLRLTSDASATPAWLDAGRIDEICRPFQAPEFYEPGETIRPGLRANGSGHRLLRRPGYFVGDDLRSDIAMLIRFGFAMAPDEAIVTFSDMAPGFANPGQAFAVTTAGLRSKHNDSEPSIYIPWDELARLDVVTDCTESTYCGIVLSDGRKIFCSSLNTAVRPFGAKLIGELIGYARSCSSSAVETRRPTCNSPPEKAEFHNRPAFSASQEEGLFRRLKDGAFAEIAAEFQEFSASERGDVSALNYLIEDVLMITSSLPGFCLNQDIRTSPFERRLIACDAVQFEIALYLFTMMQFLLTSEWDWSDDRSKDFMAPLLLGVVLQYAVRVESLQQSSWRTEADATTALRNSTTMRTLKRKMAEYMATIMDRREALLGLFERNMLEPAGFAVLQERDAVVLRDCCTRIFAGDVLFEFMRDISAKAELALNAYFMRDSE